MDSTADLINDINNISLEDEDEGGLEIITGNADETQTGFDAKLCVVGKFLTEGRTDFQALQQTLAALWKPGMGVYIKELETNLFLFQFYHEVDVKRVMEGCPWSFNRRELLMRRLSEGENPRSVPLNTMDMWIQVYDLKVGFMTERLITEVGNNIGKFVASCPTNFSGVWRDYFRVRVTIDVTKPLKRRMKIKKSAEDWYWITFKYENAPTFCFICGILGHSEKFCSRLFHTPEAEIVKLYGSWMRAPFRNHVKPIGAKWLRNGASYGGRNSESQFQANSSNSNQDPIITPPNQDAVMKGDSPGKDNFQNQQMSGKGGIRNVFSVEAIISEPNHKDKPIIIENKKRRTGTDTNPTGLNNDVFLDVNADEEMGFEQESPSNNQISKNGPEASIHGGARLAQ